jgi:hypothetical protein
MSDREPTDRPERESAEGESLLALSELCWLSDLYGAATPQLWHEVVRPDVTRLVSNRQFERMKNRLAERGIPHERVKLELDGGAPTIGIKTLIRRERLAVYFPGVAAPDTKECKACREDLPIGFAGVEVLGARLGGAFANDPTRPDGLDVYCRACRRARFASICRTKKGGKTANRNRTDAARTQKRRCARRARRTSKGRVNTARARALHKLICLGEIKRPTNCQEPTCGVEAKVFARFEIATDARGHYVMTLRFLCFECYSESKSEEAQGNAEK